MKNKLIVTAHDFGLTHSVNLGVFYSINHPENIFTEYSLLPNAPGSLEASKIARNNPKLSVNLCITLTNYKPISQNLKTMVDRDGNFLHASTSTWDFSCIDKFDEKEIKAEIDAQYDWFVKNVGRKPSALVSQKNEHGDPKILIPFVEKAKKENLPIAGPFWKWKSNYGAQEYVTNEGVKCTSNVAICLKDWKGRLGYDLESDLDQLIIDYSTKSGVTEFIVFCGFADKETLSLSSLSWQRGQYLAILERKPEILRKIRNSFQLINYGDL